MHSYQEMDSVELKAELVVLKARFDEIIGLKLSLDMTRGKPCKEQLDLARDMLAILKPGDVFSEDGSDCRNYGVPLGIKEVREFFARMLGTTAGHVIAGNNSSLNLMFDTLMRSLVFGEIESERPWLKEEKLKWLCPVPGYDRHFLVTQTLGFELIPVPLDENGPDMELVEKLVAEDASIKGMWCMPLYSNPDGFIYSPEVCRRLASMKTAAADFRILWDNAYVVHHLYDDQRGSLPDILALCEEEGHPNRVYEFASTSKVTLAGSGISCIAANKDNFERTKKYLSVQTIGPDKINELRHIRYIPDEMALQEVMRRQASLIRPKFDATLSILASELDGTGIAKWNKPLGGYFVSLHVYPGTARKVVALAKEAGVALTPAGATYPYGRDPQDANIRIAPTFPGIEDVKKAISVLCVCAKIAAVEKRLEEM